jgi:hypothetical protein
VGPKNKEINFTKSHLFVQKYLNMFQILQKRVR